MDRNAIDNIIRSQTNVAGIRLSVRAELFGVEWANGPQNDKERYLGEITKWKSKKDDELYIRWEGWSRNAAISMAQLVGVDANGDAIDARLEAYEDGRPTPSYLDSGTPPLPEPSATTRRGGHGADGTGAADEEEADMAVEDDEEEPEATPAEVDKHGTIWAKSEPKGVAVDARSRDKHSASFNSSTVDKTNVAELFMALLPSGWLEDIVQYTNLNLTGLDKESRRTTEGEILQWWGYALALSLHPGTPLDKMWSETHAPDQILPPAAMGRYGMTVKRWNKLRAKMAFGPSDETTLKSDPWAFVRPMVDKFNAHMELTIGPGWLLCVDEAMCAWRGAMGLLNPAKIPFRSWVPRKPEPLGAELKALACALSGLMLRMEICEGKAAHAAQEHTAELGVTTATTMRLCKPWFGSERVVYGDSWFASVKTAEALLNNGLHFVGDVKTATRRFPAAELESATSTERGAWAVYTTDLTLANGKAAPIFGVTHRRGEKVHKFVSTCGTTLPGKAHLGAVLDDEDQSEVIQAHEIERKCPQALNTATQAQPAIDRFNRYRQAILKMEKRLLTNNFNMRFASTMWGTVFCNSYFALTYFATPLADFRLSMTRLSLALMANNRLPEPSVPRATPSFRRAGSSPTPSSGGWSSSSHNSCHRLVELKEVMGQQWKPGQQQKCNICNKKCSYVCMDCSPSPSQLWPCCPPTTSWRGQIYHHTCQEQHRANPELCPRSKRACKRGGKRQRRPAAEQAEESDAAMCSECSD